MLTVTPSAGSVHPLEERIEPQHSPNFMLVTGHCWECRADAANVAHDLKPLGKRNERRDAVVGNQHLIRNDASDQKITPALGLQKQIKVAYVEQVEGPRRVTDAGRGTFSAISWRPRNSR
jgi:hypothetical protein